MLDLLSGTRVRRALLAWSAHFSGRRAFPNSKNNLALIDAEKELENAILALLGAQVPEVRVEAALRAAQASPEVKGAADRLCAAANAYHDSRRGSYGTGLVREVDPLWQKFAGAEAEWFLTIIRTAAPHLVPPELGDAELDKVLSTLYGNTDTNPDLRWRYDTIVSLVAEARRLRRATGLLAEVQKIVDECPELNMSNYNDDHVRSLNDAVIQIHAALRGKTA
jgi:hypothetical protein